MPVGWAIIEPGGKPPRAKTTELTDPMTLLSKAHGNPPPHLAPTRAHVGPSWANVDPGWAHMGPSGPKL